ncbi:MAG TPA: two-component regulator propeller domain-containing protein [Bacteroidota bacterium]|nr:two-component regulator propeller domain-containing protein [Bacteroidota bacterium]
MLLLSFFPALSYPEEAQKAGDRYLTTFEHIPSPNSGMVNAIIRDGHGFLWFGTTRGLCNYDGYQVRVVPNGPDINTNKQVVTALLGLGSDSLLLGTMQGVWIFSTRTEQFVPLTPWNENGVPEALITSMVEGRNSMIWIGTSSNGLFCYDRRTRSIRRFGSQEGLNDIHITSLLVDGPGRLWIGTLNHGLTLLDPSTGKVAVYNGKESLWSSHITTLCEDNDGNLWIGTSDGLSVLDTRANAVRRLDLPSPGKHSIWVLANESLPSEKHPGTMWVAASEFGLLAYRDGLFTEVKVSDDADRTLRSVKLIYRDLAGSDESKTLFWLGTREGVDKILYSRNPFTTYVRDQNGLQLNRGATLSLLQDREGILWVGLWGGGLNGLRREKGGYARVASFEMNREPSISSDDVNSLFEDHAGNLWVGTTRGVALIDRNRRRSVRYRHDTRDSSSLAGDEVGQFYEDRSGNVWICSSGGLSRYVPGNLPHFQNYLRQASGSLPPGYNSVNGIFEDRDARMWVTTSGRGLNRLEADGNFTRFTEKNDTSGRLENSAGVAVEDSTGIFWLSTGAGLVSFDRRSGTFRRFVIPQLNDAYIIGIFPDHRGFLWLATKIGLVRYSPATGSFVLLDEKHGMRFKELFSDFFRNSEGRLFVGGMDGFVEFSPESALSTSPPPEIAVTGFSVFDKDFTAALYKASPILLSHDQNFFSFTFTALDYAHSLQNRFAFRMIGVDDRWTDAGTRNYASYTNLDPGEYIFQVKGCNSLNVWNEAGTSVAISIAPPFWRAWWFELMFGAAIIAIGYAAYRYRVRKILEVERIRLRIADDLHDDVGSNLSTIAMASRSIQRAPELSQATQRKLLEIYDTALVTSEGMKDIVWFIKPENDTLDSLMLRMKDVASSLLGDIEYDFRWPKNGVSVHVTIEFKRNFFLAFKEILHNIVKHASAPRVEIYVEERNGLLEMVVRDFGRGFAEDSVRNGNGLRSMRSRASHIGGTCAITSAAGQGTTIKFSGRL